MSSSSNNNNNNKQKLLLSKKPSNISSFLLKKKKEKEKEKKDDIKNENENIKSLLGELLKNQHKYHSREAGKAGFVIDGKVCTGALQRLGDCFYLGNFKPLKKVRNGSSKVRGEQFHRQIFHYYKCTKKDCLCTAKFGTKTRALTKGSVLSKQVDAFKLFLDFIGWKVFDCELVVGWKEIGCATSLDVVCVDNLLNPTEVYVIELKTGYHNLRYQARTINGIGNMLGIAGRDIPNSYANHHQLQLWFGMEALQRTFNIKAVQGVVVYIKNNGTFKIDYAAKWWFNNIEKQKELIKQFTDANKK